MATLKLGALNIDAGSGITVDAVSWQFNNTSDFSGSVLHESLNDAVNLETYTYDLGAYELGPIYARAKVHFNTGDSKWSAIVALPKTKSSVLTNNSIIMTPTLTLDSDQNDVDINNCVVHTSEFKLFAGSAEHESTTWRVERTDGKVVWERAMDTDNKLSIKIPQFVLSHRRAYVIKAMHHTNTNANSNYGSLLVSTATPTPV